jgi:Mg2+ and Co2+ transporter CorA
MVRICEISSNDLLAKLYGFVVYNCRTSHAWPGDLALSSTYLPGSGVSFSILYGCPFATEETVIRRLKHITTEAAHPLLLPGILVELELKRHIKLIESTINKVEAKIFELDYEYANLGRPKKEVDARNEEKREAWLDLTYLRNGLMSWNTQIGRMYEHVDELKDQVFNLDEWLMADRSGKRYIASAAQRKSSGDYTGAISETVGLRRESTLAMIDKKARSRTTPETHMRDMQHVGEKIKARLNAIRDEYDEKIRDCTMRVDGMAMATQWSHGETNMEIALATNQDSKVMRSIALVTMVFLPGTFFGTVFSMSFFDWSSGDGKARISNYLWIYVVITVVCTMITVGLWYFLVVYRKKRGNVESGDSV